MDGEFQHRNVRARISGDEKFIQKINEYIDRNLENEHFGVGELADVMNLSRMQVYRKVRKITGMSVSQYIRGKKLKCALEMLKHEEGTVSEIAYKVGFGSVPYFSNCFRKQYGHPPGQANKIAEKEDRNIDKLSSVNTDEKKRKVNLSAVSAILFLIIIIPGGYYIFDKLSKIKEKDSGSIIDNNPEKSIAVMPFINDSPAEDNEYFCNGVVQEIYTHLQKISDLKVISITESEQYPGITTNTSTMASDLGVAYILRGSVRKINDNIRITTQLVDVKTGRHLWAETYDGKYTDELFVFQSNIAKQVASSLQAVITPAEQERIERKPTSEIIAYDLIMQGMHQVGDFYTTGDKKYLDSAHHIFDEAISADPTYSRSYYGKGHAFVMNDQFDSAIYYAKKTIELDPESFFGYQLMGSVYNRMGNEPDLAIEYYNKAFELAPNEPWVNQLLGDTYCFQKNDYIKGLHYMSKAIQKGVPAIHNIYSAIGWALLNIGDYNRASKYFKSSMEIRPICFRNIRGKFWILASMGKFSELINYADSINDIFDCENEYSRMKFYIFFYLNEYVKAELAFNQFIETGGKLKLRDSTYIAFVYEKLGKEHESMNIIRNITSSHESKLSDNSPWWHYLNLASVKCLLGEKKDAIHYLSKTVDIGLRLGRHDFLEFDPTFEFLRDDPEFRSLVKRAQAEKAEIRAQVEELIKKGEIDL